MTAVATYTLQAFDARSRDTHFGSHRGSRSLSGSDNSTPRVVAEEHDGYGRPTCDGAKKVEHRQSLMKPRASMGMEMAAQREGNNSSPAGSHSSSALRPRSFLRRWSGSIPLGSRDSSRSSISRPSSAAIAYATGSTTLVSSASTTPIFDRPASVHHRNRLVKRASSLSGSNGSPYQSSQNSRLPVLRRPATSHQRTATQQEQQEQRLSLTRQRESKSEDASKFELQHYFTPKIVADVRVVGRRRNSTGIPNPIRRVYPDRKYTPILVSARDVCVKRSNVEVDDASSDDEAKVLALDSALPPTAPSSPLAFDAASAARRSFSIGDLLSNGPEPLWRRPSSSASKLTISRRLSRKSRPRVATEPMPMRESLDLERPAKRRDLTDSLVAYRDVYSTASTIPTADSPKPDSRLESASDTPRSQESSYRDSPLADTFPHIATSSPFFGQDRQRSTTAESSASYVARTPLIHSEAVSTAGSDSVRRSFSGYSTDYLSENAYDSFQTRTTRSSSGKRGPPIETIFDDSPPILSSGRSTRLGDLLSDGHLLGSGQAARFRHSTIEEEESVISTPVRSLRDKSINSTPSARLGAQQLFASSPPVMADPDEIDWDAAADDGDGNYGLGIQPQSNDRLTTNPRVPNHLSTFSRSANATPTHSTTKRWSNSGTDKINIFKFAEQQPSPNHPDRSPPRPRTVHGKKNSDSRGSRTSGRRAPSGMHARSQSVPVGPPEANGKKSAAANKFGTWGVGSKNVTEDWNDDFEFEPVPPLPASAGAGEGERIDSGNQSLVLPKAIQSSQKNVVANLGLLKDWGLHVEELKDLRMRAAALDVLHGVYEQEWQQVDGVIALADHSSPQKTLEPRLTPPSSPGFDMDAFDEPATHAPAVGGPNGQMSRKVSEAALFDDADIDAVEPQRHALYSTLTPGRPRKDSEAMARSVIEALQARRIGQHPPTFSSSTSNQKVDFNATTLRALVPYVKDLTRRVKEALREAEGLYSSPRRRDSHDSGRSVDDEFAPELRSLYNTKPPGSPTELRRSRRDMALTDNDGFDERDFEMSHQQEDLAQRMQNLRLPPR